MLRKGERKLWIKSSMPEDLRALIAKNNAMRVGNILITVLMPSLEPD